MGSKFSELPPPPPGADQEHKTDEMHTALMEASMDGHVDVARLLLDHGAQVGGTLITLITDCNGDNYVTILSALSPSSSSSGQYAHG